MDDRDPGDEDTRDDILVCAFCGANLYGRHVWCTPVCPYQEPLTLFEAAELRTAALLTYETLYTCRGDCAEQARRFAVEHRTSPSNKQLRAIRARYGY